VQLTQWEIVIERLFWKSIIDCAICRYISPFTNDIGLIKTLFLTWTPCCKTHRVYTGQFLFVQFDRILSMIYILWDISYFDWMIGTTNINISFVVITNMNKNCTIQCSNNVVVFQLTFFWRHWAINAMTVDVSSWKTERIILLTDFVINNLKYWQVLVAQTHLYIIGMIWIKWTINCLCFKNSYHIDTSLNTSLQLMSSKSTWLSWRVVHV